MDKCGVTHSTAAHILICYDWNEDLVSHLWWEGENDSQIQQSRDKVCLKAGMPKHGPLVHGKKIEKNWIFIVSKKTYKLLQKIKMEISEKPKL